MPCRASSIAAIVSSVGVSGSNGSAFSVAVGVIIIRKASDTVNPIPASTAVFRAEQACPNESSIHQRKSHNAARINQPIQQPRLRRVTMSRSGIEGNGYLSHTFSIGSRIGIDKIASKQTATLSQTHINWILCILIA